MNFEKRKEKFRLNLLSDLDKIISKTNSPKVIAQCEKIKLIFNDEKKKEVGKKVWKELVKKALPWLLIAFGIALTVLNHWYPLELRWY